MKQYLNAVIFMSGNEIFIVQWCTILPDRKLNGVTVELKLRSPHFQVINYFFWHKNCLTDEFLGVTIYYYSETWLIRPPFGPIFVALIASA